jgi:predicted dehydrogenase
MPVRWGIIGVGDVCEKKSGPGFQRSEGSKLVAVCRRSLDKAQDFAKRHGVEKAYSSADEVLADKDVDAVYIATPPATHKELALKAAAAGKPCYLEKPMARNAEESLEIMEAFKKANVPLYVAYYRRGQPRFIKARRIIQSGEIGTITDVVYRFQQNNDELNALAKKGSSPWRVQASEAGGGLFMDVGCHALDIIDYIVGPLEDVQGRAYNTASAYAVEDAVTITARTTTGAPVSCTWNFAATYTQPDEIIITGTKAQLRVTACDINPPLKLLTKNADGGVDEQLLEFDPPAAVQQPLIQLVVDDLTNKDGSCPSTPESAYRTALVLDKALDSYYGGRETGFWEREPTWPKSIGILRAPAGAAAIASPLIASPLIASPLDSCTYGPQELFLAVAVALLAIRFFSSSGGR